MRRQYKASNERRNGGAEVHNTKNKDVCSATPILLSFEKQIVTNIPYGNKLKRFSQIN